MTLTVILYLTATIMGPMRMIMTVCISLFDHYSILFLGGGVSHSGLFSFAVILGQKIPQILKIFHMKAVRLIHISNYRKPQ